MRSKMSGNEEYSYKIMMWLLGVTLRDDHPLMGRIRKLPQGEKRFKTVCTQLGRLMTDISDTVDCDQIVKMVKEMENGRVYFKVQPMGRKEAERAEEWTTASKYDLQVIMDCAGKSECTFCDKSREDAAQCPLRKAMRKYTYGDEGKEIDGCAYRGWDWRIED